MKRKLLSQLIAWKNSPDRKPLILDGARQVGKTYLLKDVFGREYYDNVVYLNLQNPLPEVAEAFAETLDPKRLLSRLELLLNTDIIPGKTLIFLDEIQELPRALTSLKYFYEEAPEYHVVAAGSLLGVFLHVGTSFPVGKVDRLRLEPMDFQEFLWAKGEEKIVNHLLQSPEDGFFRTTLLDDFREYLFVGGMPEVVQRWVADQDISRVDEIQQRILLSYRSDFSKYPNDTTAIRIGQVFDSLPAQFAKSNEKFVYGLIKEGARAREYELAIEWLVDAGLIRRVYRVERGDKLPLRAYIDRSAFKLYFLDVGLFRQLAGIPSSVVVQKNAIFDEFNGLIAEQFVLQELAGHELFYWSNEATAEVDFVGQFGTQIIPIEVKSGENVRAKSLRLYRDKYHPALALRTSLLDLQYSDGLLNLPLYESFLLPSLIQKYSQATPEP